MPHYRITYAYDCPRYLDFAVKAPTKRAALAKAMAALKAGKLYHIEIPPGNYDDMPSDHRVFTPYTSKRNPCLTPDEVAGMDTLDALVNRKS